MHKIMIFLLVIFLITCVVGCNNSQSYLEGVYIGRSDINKILTIEDSTYFYAYKGERIFEGKWTFEENTMLFFNFSLISICDEMKGMEGAHIYVLKYNQDGYLIFSEDVSNCNFLHEKLR
jgi:hypothetical protein